MKTVFFLSTLFLCLQVFSQAPEIIWQNTIGAEGDEVLTIGEPTSDGGYIIGGSSNSGISGDKTEACFGEYDYWVVKLNNTGEIEWQRTLGGDSFDFLRSICQTTDGGYILGGNSSSGISGNKTEDFMGGDEYVGDYWIIKLDYAGNIEWQNTIGTTDDDYFWSVIQTTDGGYVLGGNSEAGISGDKTEEGVGGDDYWILKLDAGGDIAWQEAIGGSGLDWLFSIEQTTDSGYILGGYSMSNISGDKTEDCLGNRDYWIVKINAAGDVEWDNTVGGNEDDRLLSVRQTLDGKYIIAGYSTSGISGDKTEENLGEWYYTDCWIVKLNTAGELEWENTIGGTGMDHATTIEITTDGNYVIGGHSFSDISSDKSEMCLGAYDFWLLEISPEGEILWDNTIGGNGNENLNSVHQVAGEKFILIGSSDSNISGDKSENSIGWNDYWITYVSDEYNQITGSAFLDLNSNLIKDASEPVLASHALTENTTGKIDFTDGSGYFSIYVIDSGSFSVSPDSLLYYSPVPASHTAEFDGITQIDSLNDFAFQPAGTFYDLSVLLTPLGAFRPGFDAFYQIEYSNIGTTTLSGEMTFYPDSNLAFLSATTTPDMITDDSLVWYISDLSPYESSGIIITVNVSASLAIDDSIISLAVINTIEEDVNTANNLSGWDVIVTGSFDPNDILVDKETIIYTEPVPYLEYIILFQNTGTDTAFNISISNPLSNKLDVSSIQIVNYSHDVAISYDDFSKSMKFEFNDILLPDSNTNELLSHGFVRYRIKPEEGIDLGDLIVNNASIFFDFNLPVLTSDAITSVLLPVPVLDNIPPDEFVIFPNPAGSVMYVEFDVIKQVHVEIVDALGKIIRQLETSNSKVQMDISNLSEGLYFIKITSNGKTVLKKFVKE
ncbi:MAG: T9SS type A sorting domain-containing protein [Chitinophagales bacterium]|nr:T9SS type A sorting domain-containing protein [Chitinophagales bacterium]